MADAAFADKVVEIEPAVADSHFEDGFVGVVLVEGCYVEGAHVELDEPEGHMAEQALALEERHKVGAARRDAGPLARVQHEERVLEQPEEPVRVRTVAAQRAVYGPCFDEKHSG